MGEQEILGWLEEQRKSTNQFFTAREIKIALEQKYNCKSSLERYIYDKLLKLTQYNLIECRGVGVWHHQKRFRYKIE